MTSRGPSVEVEPEALMQRLTAGPEGPRVVAIGGGHGLAQALKAVTRYAGDITAVVTVADDGGSSGRLAPDLEIPPPGDIRQCLLALTPEDSVWRRLFEYRFGGADVQGHSLGNLILAALRDVEGDFARALDAAEALLGSVGSVVPVAGERLLLTARVDGEHVEGQVAIALSRGVIEELQVMPEDVEASDRALDAIVRADQIVLGPGSLYTSVMAALVVPGVVEAINASAANLVYVANLITQDGETLGMDCADHLHALLEISGIRQPSTIVANQAEVTVTPPLEALVVEPEVVETYGVDVVLADVVDKTAYWPRHEPAKLGGVLARLVSSEFDPGGAIT